MAASSYTFRKLDIHRDLLPVADLIELCFAHQMDTEGRDFIRFIRRAATDRRYKRLLEMPSEPAALTLNGYVCEAEGRVVGNLSLFLIWHAGIWRYLIANVAVHPGYRRQGIARRLTELALTYARQHGAHAAWLQVRDNNPAAVELYRSLGFVERSRRTTWLGCRGYTPTESLSNGILINQRQKQDWHQQIQWLGQIYPPEVAWNLSLEFDRLRPGLLYGIIRWLNGDIILHWAARQSGQLLGVATWQPGQKRTDHLWLAVNPEQEDQALNSLLPFVRVAVPKGRPPLVNYPAGRGDRCFGNNGFEYQHTLIWMEARFEPNE